MGRIILTFAIAIALAAGVGWYFGIFDPAPTTANTDGTTTKTVDRDSLGDWLYKPAADPKRREIQRVKTGQDPIVIPGNLEAIDKVDVSSATGGEILYIGDGVPEGVSQIAGIAPFMQANYEHAKVTQGGRSIYKFYRPLHKSSKIYGGQMVGEIDFARGLNNYLQKNAKVIKAFEELIVARKIDVVAQERLEIEIKLRTGAKEIADAKLTKIKTFQEVVKAEQEWEEAKIDLDSAKILLELHEIRPKRPFQVGYIKTVYKDTGEAVKELEQVMHVYSIDRLMAEAFVESQYYHRLRENMTATIEPAQDEMPLRMFEGHRAKISGVAFVAADKDLYVVSAAEDGLMMLWQQHEKGAIASVAHREVIKALACSPRGVKKPLAAVGTVDGKIYLYNLFGDKGPLPRPTMALTKPLDIHRDAVTAIAFSPDGAYFVSGAADGTIALWRTGDDKPQYVFDHAHGADNPHQGAITSLAFTPQCRLVSAARDNTLRIWNLKKEGAYLEGLPIDRRSGSIQQLGVSQDGRWMLFDQGKSLQFLSAADGQMVNTLKNPGGATPFETLAVFSQDASLILTGGAPEGRLQLWRSPIKTDSDKEEIHRGFEVRQFATEQRSPVTCAAFAPAPAADGEARFAVSGTKDGFVYLWPVPTRQDVKDHCIQNVPVRVFQRSVEAGSRQLRVGVEVPNLNDRLYPGRPVTIVME